MAASGRQSVKITCFPEKGGSFNRGFTVKPGERYLVGFKARNVGKGTCSLSICWRSKGKFTRRDDLSVGLLQKGKWTPVAAVVAVPERADELILAVSVRNQDSGSVCHVDDLMLYRLD
jgi:hypothetical protein